jgi:membrane associated rhomboid family serine protease
MFNRAIPPVTKNLLIINGLFFIATIFFAEAYHINLARILGLHYWASPDFQPYQLVTFMFMHGGWSHILFNMFGLWMFGSAIESYWGPKRYLIYYMVTGLGSGVLWMLTIYVQVAQISPALTPDMIDSVNSLLTGSVHEIQATVQMQEYYRLVLSTVVGASGALFGLLLAFGMMFPNTPIYLMFIPIPIKAKYMVMGYGFFELYEGIANNPGDNIAHFAHLGGMLFGIIMIMYWKKKGTFYKPW